MCLYSYLAWDFEWLWEGFLAGALWSVGGQSERSSREGSRQHLHLHVAFQGLHVAPLTERHQSSQTSSLTNPFIVTNSNTLVAKEQMKHQSDGVSSSSSTAPEAGGDGSISWTGSRRATGRWFLYFCSRHHLTPTGANEQNRSHYKPTRSIIL